MNRRPVGLTAPHRKVETKTKWSRLTDDEIIREADKFDWDKDCAVRFARVIEKRVQEKNT